MPSLGSSERLMEASSKRTPSTKAVLEALRALQSKIERLERERSRALDEATALRLKYDMAESRRKTEEESRAATVAEMERWSTATARELSELKLRLAARDDELGRTVAEAARKEALLDARLATTAASAAARAHEAAADLAQTRSRCLDLELRVESLESARALLTPFPHQDAKTTATKKKKKKSASKRPVAKAAR